MGFIGGDYSGKALIAKVWKSRIAEGSQQTRQFCLGGKLIKHGVPKLVPFEHQL